MKSREDLLNEVYLNKAEISRLLKVSPPAAKKIFDSSMALDNKVLGNWKIYNNRVRINSVMKVAGIDYNLLQKQIKKTS